MCVCIYLMMNTIYDTMFFCSKKCKALRYSALNYINIIRLDI